MFSFLSATPATGPGWSWTEGRSGLRRTVAVAVAGRASRLSDDYHIAFLKIAGDNFRNTAISDPSANDARLQSLVGGQYPDDLNLALLSAPALASGWRGWICAWLLSWSLLRLLSCWLLSFISALRALLVTLLPTGVG